VVVVCIKLARVTSQGLYFVSTFKEDSAIWNSFTCSTEQESCG
jgi:hypothetical protein